MALHNCFVMSYVWRLAEKSMNINSALLPHLTNNTGLGKNIGSVQFFPILIYLQWRSEIGRRRRPGGPCYRSLEEYEAGFDQLGFTKSWVEH